jgi:hypothetical protein
MNPSYCCRSRDPYPSGNERLQRRIFSSRRTGFVFSFVAQASKFAGLSDATESGISVAEFINCAAEVRRDEEKGGELWYQVLFYGF